jgi:hypothetical protein
VKGSALPAEAGTPNGSAPPPEAIMKIAAVRRQTHPSLQNVPPPHHEIWGHRLITGASANEGPLEKETFGERFSLFAWDGSPGPNNVAMPQKLIDDLGPYTTRPEGVDLIQIDQQWRVIFVEDRYRAKGYGTRNAVHWPISILGTVE